MSTEEAKQRDDLQALAASNAVEVPRYTSVFSFVTGRGLDFVFLFQALRLLRAKDGGILSDHQKIEDVVELTMSPQSAKDLSIILAEQVAAHEKMFGEIKTPFTNARDTASKAENVVQ